MKILEKLLEMEHMFMAESCEEPAFGKTHRIHFDASHLASHQDTLARAQSLITKLCASKKEAVEAERRRCAAIVENMGRSNGRVRKPYRIIAAEILAAKPRIGVVR